MSDKLRLKRNQLEAFITNDPDAVRTIERLIEIVNRLQEEIEALEARVTALEP